MGLLVTSVTNETWILCMTREGHGQSHPGPCLTTMPTHQAGRAPLRGGHVGPCRSTHLGDGLVVITGGMDKEEGANLRRVGGLWRPGSAARADVMEKPVPSPGGRGSDICGGTGRDELRGQLRQVRPRLGGGGRKSTFSVSAACASYSHNHELAGLGSWGFL